jgi:hypothetical protein
VLGSCDLEVRSDVVLRIDFSASLGFLTNICKRAAPYLVYRSWLACLIVSRVTTLCSL